MLECIYVYNSQREKFLILDDTNDELRLNNLTTLLLLLIRCK